MVRRRTEYRKRQCAIQEAYCAPAHLRKSRVKPRVMDMRTEWNAARKLMTDAESLRVSFTANAHSSVGNANGKTLREIVGGRVNALEASHRDCRKRMLNAVVEVRYTTARLPIAG
jgi:hypothetical protein